MNSEKLDEPGIYWIRYRVPVTDGGGVVDEHWSPPVLARKNGIDWYLLEGGELSDQCSPAEVLSERIEPPRVDDSKERRLAVLVLDVVEEWTWVEPDERKSLVDKITEILKSHE